MRANDIELLRLRADLAAARMQVCLLKLARWERKRAAVIPNTATSTEVIADREAFEAQLDAEIRANSEMLVNSLNTRKLTPDDLLDVSEIRE